MEPLSVAQRDIEAIATRRLTYNSKVLDYKALLKLKKDILVEMCAKLDVRHRSNEVLYWKFHFDTY